MGVKQRLLLLIHVPPPVHGAAVMGAHVLASRLLQRTFDVDVIPLRFADSPADLERPSLRKLVNAGRLALQLANALVTRRPDAIYFTISTAGGAFYRDCVYVALMKLLRVRRVFHLHARGERPATRPTWRRALLRWAFDGAHVIHLSPLLAEELEGIVDKERLSFVANGVADTGECTRTPGCGGLRILFLANLVETKGPLILIDALRRLRAEGVPFEATFAGAPGTGAFFSEFLAAVSAMGSCVRYVGPVYGGDKERLFQEHDVFVMPTLRDAFSLVVLEAMQHGLPVVTTVEGAMPEIVEDRRTGFLVPCGDAAAVAARIAELARDRELSATMGARGRERYCERFTLERFEANLVRVLEDVVS